MLKKSLALIKLVVVISLGFIQSLAIASDRITLTSQEFSSLGIESSIVSSLSKNIPSNWYPGKVVVPTKNQQLVTSEFAGVISRIHVANGEKVRRGQFIAEISSSRFLELQREMQQSNIQQNLLQRNYQRDQELFKAGIVSESRLQASKSQYEQNQALVLQYQRSFNLAKYSVKDNGNTLQIKSPIDAVILELNVQLGQRIEQNSLLARLANLQTLEIEFQYPLNLMNKLNKNSLFYIKQNKSTAKISAINYQADSSSQTVMIRALFDNSKQNLLPEQLVEISLNNIENKEQNTSLIPMQSISDNSGEKVAYIIEKNNNSHIISRRKIELLETRGEFCLVRGIKNNEDLVIKGIASIKLLFEQQK